MRQLALRIALLILCASIVVFAGQKPGQRIVKHLPLDGVPGVVMKNRTNSEFLPGRLIVKLMPQVTTSLSKSAFGIQSVDRVLSQALGVAAAQMFPTVSVPQKANETDLSLLYTVLYTSPNDPFTLADQLSQLPEVQYAEPWFIYPLSDRTFVPNDPLYSLQYALNKVKAPAAWDITQGDSTVVVAIVDSGVEWDHPDLAANIWTNPGETGLDAFGRDKRFNGIDDDGDGYVDDWHGWDFVGAQFETYNPGVTKGDNDPSPTGLNNSHGTHVAGIVAATTNNAIGVASLAAKCRILPIKTSADDDARSGGEAYILAGYQGIVYAALMGAKIINCSWGGPGGAQAEQDIVDFATQHGALVVAAAGNDLSTEFFSPASYRGVLSVAATDNNDALAYFSNYGDNIDVCAPGVLIYSTFYPNTYTMLSGTSMSSPLAASVAALVKSKFPNYTPLQVGEQVRVTCDNIDGLNLGLAGQLGRGRVDALQALTVTNLPSMRLQSYTISDVKGGNGNGIAQPAETLSVACTYMNYLARTTAAASVQLSTDSPYLTILQGTFATPTVGTLDSISNPTTPFRVYVRPTVPESYFANLTLTFSDGSFSDVQHITFIVSPTYATENVNAIQLTLTNNSRLGFFDFPTNTLGVGFVFNHVNYLFEGGLILGRSATQIVDVVRNETGGQDADLSARGFFRLQTPGITSDQDGVTTFNDSVAAPTNRIGLQVAMHSFAFSDPTDSKYIILQYDIQNITSSPVSNLYAGIFLDWDIGNDSELVQNYSKFDPSRSLGYAYNGARTGPRGYVGIRALDSAGSYRSLSNDGSIDLTRAGKWAWISGGFANATVGPTDIHHVMSEGPFTIGAGVTRRIGFALVAGDSSLANIQQNADAAKAKWLAINAVVGINNGQPAVPLTYALDQNFPNPFNPGTTIRFQIPKRAQVTLQVFDLLGRCVGTLIDDEREPGSYSIRWDASALSSGVYFYRLRAGDFVQTRKLVLMK